MWILRYIRVIFIDTRLTVKGTVGNMGDTIHGLCFTMCFSPPHSAVVICYIYLCQHLEICLEILPVDRWKPFVSPRVSTLRCKANLFWLDLQAPRFRNIAGPQKDRHVCVSSFGAKIAQSGCFSSTCIYIAIYSYLVSQPLVSSWWLLFGPSAEHNQDVSEEVHVFVWKWCWGSLSKRRLWIDGFCFLSTADSGLLWRTPQ